jgi:hypothetical protein
MPIRLSQKRSMGELSDTAKRLSPCVDPGIICWEENKPLHRSKDLPANRAWRTPRSSDQKRFVDIFLRLNFPGKTLFLSLSTLAMAKAASSSDKKLKCNRDLQCAFSGKSTMKGYARRAKKHVRAPSIILSTSQLKGRFRCLQTYKIHLQPAIPPFLITAPFGSCTCCPNPEPEPSPPILEKA